MENKNILRYIAGGCFAVYALIYISTLVRSFNIWNLLLFIAVAIIAVGILIKVPILVTVGSVLRIILALRSVIMYATVINSYKYDYGMDDVIMLYKRIQLRSIVVALFFMVLLLVSILPNLSKVLGFVAGGLGVVQLVLPIVQSTPINALSIIQYVLFIVGAILFGLYMDGNQATTIPKPKAVASTSAISSTQVAASNKIERLIKLKELLDKGIISQEEFDEKKKQILS